MPDARDAERGADPRRLAAAARRTGHPGQSASRGTHQPRQSGRRAAGAKQRHTGLERRLGQRAEKPAQAEAEEDTPPEQRAGIEAPLDAEQAIAVVATEP